MFAVSRLKNPGYLIIYHRLSQGYSCYVKPKQPRPGLELRSSRPFSLTIIVSSRVPPNVHICGVHIFEYTFIYIHCKLVDPSRGFHLPLIRTL